MNNLQQPAFPVPNKLLPDGAGGWVPMMGLTKLEYAAIEIAKGIMSNTLLADNEDEYIARDAVKIAKAVLEEANK